MIAALDDEPRLIVDAKLRPVLGSTFQPTGFANLGAAEFTRPGCSPSLLVESVQSLTNHFEALGFDRAAGAPIALLETLPWIDVRSPDGAEHLTSSREEPHRLAAAYVNEAQIEDTKGIDWIVERLGLRPRKPTDWSGVYEAVFDLDPLCLLHGVFFSRPGHHGNPKVRRALSAVIEAHGVTPVHSGGLKRDDVQFTAAAGQRAEGGYGFVPFGRTEYAAEEIRFTAVLDLVQLRGYGLPSTACRLLVLLGLWEVAGLLGEPLRLRTACDLEVESVSVRRPASYSLPSRADLEVDIRETVAEVAFADPGARVVTWPAPTGG